MKKVLSALFMASLAAGLLAQGPPDPGVARARPAASEVSHRHYFPSKNVRRLTPLVNNLNYHPPAPVLASATVVLIFWGPSFQDPADPDFGYAQELVAFRDQFGTTGEYNTITQYYQDQGLGPEFIQLANLGIGTPDWFDGSAPPTAVTDADVRNEVLAYLATQPSDPSTVYEVFIPSTSYSTDRGATSCGGPNLRYCAYHGYFFNGTDVVKYSIEPYPSCRGCQVAGWSDAQNQEHFVCHETRETVTDPQLNAWYDVFGNEADDKCAWNPTPFIGTGGFGYQYEWSNEVGACVQTR